MAWLDDMRAHHHPARAFMPHWQAAEFNRAWRYAFLALVRKSPDHQDARSIEATSVSWANHIGILNRRIEPMGEYDAGAAFSLADIPIGSPVQHHATRLPCYHSFTDERAVRKFCRPGV
jgi:glutathione S-transferase